MNQSWLSFIPVLIACGVAAATGEAFRPGAWYKRLDRRSWTPPDWAFGGLGCPLSPDCLGRLASRPRVPAGRWRCRWACGRARLRSVRWWTPIFLVSTARTGLCR